MAEDAGAQIALQIIKGRLSAHADWYTSAVSPGPEPFSAPPVIRTLTFGSSVDVCHTLSWLLLPVLRRFSQ